MTNDNYVQTKDLYINIYFLDYWIIYILSWVIVPVAQEYIVSTELTKKEKLKKAIKTNLLFYLIFLMIGILFIMYLIFNRQLTG